MKKYSLLTRQNTTVFTFFIVTLGQLFCKYQVDSNVYIMSQTIMCVQGYFWKNGCRLEIPIRYVHRTR